jgi:c-di-GMP-binding flagellar brake protein YcgR
MELSLDQFVALLQRFESNPEPQDVRRTARIVIRRHVTIVTESNAGGTEMELVLQDISRGGVSLTHHEGMPRDKRFVLLLPTKGSREPIQCVVRHCEMVKQHLFRIGAQFESPDRPASPA